MNEHVLQIRFPSSDGSLEERVRGGLFVSRSTGDISEEGGEITTIRAFFADPPAREEAVDALSLLEGLSLERVDMPATDWLDHYQQSLKPIHVGTRFVVVPEAALATGAGRTTIIIPQERAFGTGSHESTALCMEMLESADVGGKLCADIGTGSGILAIALHHLGARRVVAFDDDLETFGVVHKNLERNAIPEGAVLQFFGSTDALRPGTIDLAVMNILPDVIVALLPEVVTRLSPAAEIVFSGILVSESGRVKTKAAECDLVLTRESTRGEWWCGSFTVGALAATTTQ